MEGGRTSTPQNAYTGIRAVIRSNSGKKAERLMLRSIQWAALGTGFTFLMTTLGAAVVFFLTGEPKPRFQKDRAGLCSRCDDGGFRVEPAAAGD